jgi:hypothetical protein
MPYFITDKSPDCSGWATIKEDGEVIGCHSTKQDAIDQMVAVSIAEDLEPGGERALPDNYRPALSEMFLRVVLAVTVTSMTKQCARRRRQSQSILYEMG